MKNIYIFSKISKNYAISTWKHTIQWCIICYTGDFVIFLQICNAHTRHQGSNKHSACMRGYAYLLVSYFEKEVKYSSDKICWDNTYMPSVSTMSTQHPNRSSLVLFSTWENSRPKNSMQHATKVTHHAIIKWRRIGHGWC